MVRRSIALLAIPFLCAACQKTDTGSIGRVVQLPGFDVQLPTGTVLKSTRHPGSGSHHVRYGFNWNLLFPEQLARYLPSERGSIKISWRAGPMTAEGLAEHRQLTSDLMVGIATKDKRSIVIDERRWVDAMTISGKPVSMGYAYCEPGLLVTVAVGDATGHDASNTTRRIVESIVCRLDAIPTLPDPNLNLPAHFGRTLIEDSATYVSPEGIGVSATHSHGDLHIDREALTRLLQNASMQIFEAQSMPDLILHDLTRPDGAKSIFGEIVYTEAQDTSFVATLYCAEVDFTILAFLHGAEVEARLARELAENIDCSFAPKNVRSVSEVFDEACAAGEAQACAELSVYVEEGTASADHGTAAELRARACALGASDFCTDV